MKTKPQSTITCPVCKRTHGLFWKVYGPEKRELVYLCDRIEHLKSVDYSAHPEMRIVKSVLLAPAGTVPADNLPEKLSRKWKTILQEKSQPRIPL